MTTTMTAEVGPTVADRRSRRPVAVGAAATALVAAGSGLGLYPQNLHNGMIAASFTAVGAFVAHRHPDHREARLFLATGAAEAVIFSARQYGLHSATRGDRLPWAEWVTWLGVWPLPLVLVLVATTIMCFPDGRLPSPRWRVAVAGMLAAGTAVAVLSALWPVEYADNALPVEHPLRLAGGATAQVAWSVLGPAAYLGIQLVWVVAVGVRLRQARGDEAAQLRWFVYAVLVTAAAMAVGFAVFRSPTLGVLAIPAIPVTAGAAIVKYRLYDIDVVISRTLLAAIMATAVTAAYLAVVVGVGSLLGVTAQPNLTVALLATSIVAVAFDPVRRRVQQGVDRLVHGPRTTAYEALARLSGQLAQTEDRADLFAGLASTVAAGVGASTVTLWVGPADQLVPVAAWPPGSPAGDQPIATLPALEHSGRLHVRPIVHQGLVRGAVTLTQAPGAALTPVEDRLLRDLAAQTGLVIENVGLGAELQDRLRQISGQAAELRAAAKRIVEAQDQARRRIERDLHDGAQQRLVTLALDLQAIEQQAGSLGDDGLVAAVDRARGDLTLALSELREMARGIHPALLTEDGLEAALSFLAERSPLPVHLDAQLPHRLPSDLESTAYFVVSEALANAAKHSAASSVRVVVGVVDGRLVIDVADDGCGGADGRRGSGLQGLVDRLATVNGSLVVRSPHAGGTRLRAEIPCG